MVDPVENAPDSQYIERIRNQVESHAKEEDLRGQAEKEKWLRVAHQRISAAEQSPGRKEVSGEIAKDSPEVRKVRQFMQQMPESAEEAK